MLAPWNESGAAEHLPFRSFAIRLAQTLYHRGDVIPLGRTPWNLYHSPVFMFPGTHLIPSWHNLYQQTDGIPLGLALWNPNRPATRMALGISAGRSERGGGD
jgi:hypothetical protein